MSTPLEPLRFKPIFQYRLWGGSRLARVLAEPLPGSEPIGEAWVLSDRDDFSSEVAHGEFQGQTLTELVARFPEAMLGKHAKRYKRFPLLLKFLDAREMLSVQVHPSDDQVDLLPEGERGKTEAWVVLEADADSKIYAGLQPDVTPESLRQALVDGSVERLLHKFTPRAGDGVFLRAGTVHALGGGVMVFEVQENSDVTFRMYDWGRVDAKTGKSRELHIDQAIACTEFGKGSVDPVVPVVESEQPVRRERLFNCEHFRLWRTEGDRPFLVGALDEPRVLVCLEGKGEIGRPGAGHALGGGEVMLLPAAQGPCRCLPLEAMNLLEIALPDHP